MYTQTLTYTIPSTDVVLDADDKPYILKFRDLPKEEKPREKLLNFGPGALSVDELLAIILAVGTRRENVLAMSQRLIREYGGKTVLTHTDPKRIQELFDIPLTKACQVVACFELGRRFYKPANGRPQFLRTAKEVFEYVNDMRDLSKEYLRGIYLNNRFVIVHDEIISIGTLTANIIHPREVYKPCFEHAATALILVHNHPSGAPDPSNEDLAVTKQLEEAGKILGITLLDHVVVTQSKFNSIMSLETKHK